MTAEEIKKRLKELEITNSEFGYGDFTQDDEQLGSWKEVVQHGGEGEGENWYSVKYFEKHNIYLRIDGYYSSYYGVDFDDSNNPYEVKPQSKTITVYESI